MNRYLINAGMIYLTPRIKSTTEENSECLSRLIALYSRLTYFTSFGLFCGDKHLTAAVHFRFEYET